MSQVERDSEAMRLAMREIWYLMRLRVEITPDLIDRVVEKVTPVGEAREAAARARRLAEARAWYDWAAADGFRSPLIERVFAWLAERLPADEHAPFVDADADGYADVLRDVAARAAAAEVLVAEEGGELLGTITFVPDGGVLGEIGVGPDPQPTELVGPLQELAELGVGLFAASADEEGKAAEVAESGVSFAVGWGVTRETGDRLGAWWDERRGHIQPAEFVVRQPDEPLAATHSEDTNVVRLMFDPHGLRPHVANWPDVAQSLIQRIHREAVGGVQDPATVALLDEILAAPGVPRQRLDIAALGQLAPPECLDDRAGSRVTAHVERRLPRQQRPRRIAAATCLSA